MLLSKKQRDKNEAEEKKESEALKKEVEETLQKSKKSTATLNSYNEAVDFFNTNGCYPEDIE